MCGIALDPNAVGFIYGLHAGDHNIRYIGLTTSLPRKRLDNHLRTAIRLPDRLVSQWISEAGPKNIEVCIIESFTPETVHDLKSREVYHIKEGRNSGLRLCNVTNGGDGRLGYTTSEETKKKQSEARKGIVFSPETIEKMRKARTGKKHSDAVRSKISASSKGRKQSPESNAKRSAAMSGRTSKSSHTRYHTNRGLVREGCVYCT